MRKLLVVLAVAALALAAPMTAAAGKAMSSTSWVKAY
jgi:hypothetical protein